MAETDSQPIAENEQVKELLALLKDNNTPGYEEFAKLIEHVTGMEQRLLEATEELKAVRQEMKGLQNHSLKDALQKSCKAMETNISAMRHRLSELKGQIINGCRNILADFRERGAVALNGITQFYMSDRRWNPFKMQQKKVCKPATGLLPELMLSVRNTTKWGGISKIWAVLFKENLRRQTQKKNGKGG